MRFSKLLNNKVNRSFAGTLLLLIFTLCVAVVMVFPMVLIVGNSFKPLNELWIFPPKILPLQPTTANYSDLLTTMVGSLVPMSKYLFNTVFITVVGTAGHILFASMCAYPLAKRKFPGRNVIFSIIVLTLMFNATVTGIPNYLIMSKIGWIDTLKAIVVPAFGSSLGLYLMKQFMESSIPDSLLEAATVDGAKQITVFTRIIMPNVKPAWMTLMLLSVQNLWGVGSSNFILSEEKKTFAYALQQISAGGLARAGVAAAISVVMMIVPIGIFIFSQSQVMETMSSSGMKD